MRHHNLFLNIICDDQKDFLYTVVRAEVDKAQAIADLYEFAQSFLPTLKLSKNAIRYYADVAEQYAVSRLRQLSNPQQWLHTLCFINHSYQQIMDSLITSFMYHTRTIRKLAKLKLRCQCNDGAQCILVVDFPKLAQFLEWFQTWKKEPIMMH